LPDGFTNPVEITADKRVEHQRDTAVARMAALLPGIPVHRKFRCKVVDVLTDQMSKEIRTHLASESTRFGAPSGCEPDWQLRLDWSWQNPDRYVFSVHTGTMHRFTAPEPLDRVDVAEHHALPIGVILGRQNKVVDLPSRRERHAHTPPRQILHHRPFLGDPDRILKRKDDTSSAYLNPFGDRGHCCARHRRIRKESTEGMEVPLRGPDCLEAVPIRELRSFEEQAIALLRILSLVAREIEKTEPHSLLLHGTASGAPISAGIVSEDDDCESATQGPEELQHGNIKRDARHGEPDTSLTSNAPVHTEEEVCNVPMGDHYSFWRARGTRCVNQV